ncbi:MAG: response regulator transcription factor [Solirubrobacteraceae bacterium]
MNPPHATILLVEDHRTTRIFLADNLVADGYEIIECDTVGAAHRTLETHYPDLAIIDLGLPDRDGLELLAEVRGADRACSRLDPDLPMVVLSGRTTDLDRLRGFEKGADDYLQKPFGYPELRARIEALLRRTRRRPGIGRIRVGALELDPVGRAVRLDGRPVALSKKEYALLRALAAEPTRVYTREELLRGVWGYQTMGTTRTLDSHASRLRKKLSVAGASFVINVWGVGYRLIDGASG